MTLIRLEYIEELYDKENKPSEDKLKMKEEIAMVDENLILI